ncbi:dTDP-4-dehydrorhamnose reductase [uncultured Herbaspirillum sp.]|uniref:dTDP-4-dehydrorhamnose reductase n=1 Tax=uncultured Herbaspirillum sp. TaxID=160236 RepID=UPI00258F622E|nr:dTDP-4-dehydrorhamnose reductase [uncultured Herbaspirillum sp.]
MKILLTGATGQIGHALATSLSSHTLLTPTRAELNLAEPAGITSYIDRTAPDLIINPAAYTAVDKAEAEPELARLINTEAVRALAQAAARHGIGLVHFSTDYVFDGSKDAPYIETDPTCPISVYGRTKRDGESAILESGCPAWILRTSWIFGGHGSNFMKTILRLAQERDRLSIVNDQYGAPTSDVAVAEAVTQMIGQGWDRMTSYMRDSTGIYHLTCSGHTNWHEYACRVVDAMPALGLVARINSRDIAGIPSSAYPTPAQRPKNSRLCTDKVKQTFNLSLPHWAIALDQCLETMVTPG